jgi:anthranilate phosphoribosyltransferase
MSVLDGLTEQLQSGRSLTRTDIAQAIDAMMSGGCDQDSVSNFLLALRGKGETVDELAGAAAALRRHMRPIASHRPNLLDTCGTGGDGSQTFNISTAAALVTAAAGQPVAKHGNRSITSRSGSADVLRQLGVNIEATLAQIEHCLTELGICFCYAPLFHPSMQHVAAVRRALGVPTIFNLLGPLCNPASAPFQLLGVGRSAIRPLIAQALQQLGTRHSLVVTGDDGLDEVTLSGLTMVADVTPARIVETNWTPERFGVQRQALDALRVDGPEASAALITGILRGQRGAARDIVLINAAAALCITDHSREPADAMQAAAEAIDSGAATQLLSDLARLSHL